MFELVEVTFSRLPSRRMGSTGHSGPYTMPFDTILLNPYDDDLPWKRKSHTMLLTQLHGSINCSEPMQNGKAYGFSDIF
jgi:hypothetical protein